MTYEEAISYIHATSWKGSRPGLERITKLLCKIGNPQQSFYPIHVAGTNGKGSYCAMLENVLLHAGYSTGMFTSPYVEHFEERFRAGGEMISHEELAEITEFIQPFADEMEDAPTEFELITAIGFEFFRRKKVDIAIVECGMGGRLDSTNVFRKPLLCVVTGIAKDHTEYLGNTLEKIALEKAGIFHPGRPVLYGGSSGIAEKVIHQRAVELGCPYIRPDRKDLYDLHYDINGTDFGYRFYDGLRLSLLGTYQPYNAINVIETVRYLRNAGLHISLDAIREGLRTASWKARFEMLSADPIVIYDGGHNAEGVKAAVESAKVYFPGQKLRVMTGVMADKEYRRMAKMIAEIADTVYTVTPENPRALSAKDYAIQFQRLGINVSAYDQFSDATAAAVKDCRHTGQPLLVLGSLYAYCSFKPALMRVLKAEEN